MSERYVLPKGFSGNYQLLVRRVWGEVTSNKVSVTVFHHYRSPEEGSLTRQVDLDDKGAIVLFNLANGRRTDSLEEQAIQSIVRNQIARNQLVFGQQFLQESGTGSGSGSGNGGGIGPGNGGFGGQGDFSNLLFRRPVGYQPQISQIPEGGGMTINHVATSDRLHVIISISPFFQQVSSVATFNIFGDADTAGGLGGGGGGGLGGGGGGGLGGGGGGIF